MRHSNHGLVNIYLKTGVALLLAAVAAIIWTSFPSTDAVLQGMVRNFGAAVLLAGMVVYAIGRIVQRRVAD